MVAVSQLRNRQKPGIRLSLREVGEALWRSFIQTPAKRSVTHLRNKRERGLGFDAGRTQPARMHSQGSADGHDQMPMIRQWCPYFQGCAASPKPEPPLGGKKMRLYAFVPHEIANEGNA